jgi:hypothetical protein
MNTNREAILQLLKKELEFVNNGGYRFARRSLWRPAYIFEDSPGCPNVSDRARPNRCQDCWLMEFVAPEFRSEQAPCRFVQLAPTGVTVDSLYRCGTQAETEEALRHWLNQRIHELEREIQEAKTMSSFEMGCGDNSAVQ